MTKNIIAVDLDGTLLNSNSKVSKENLKAIKNLALNGIKTVVITGRTFYEIPEELRTNENIEYIVFSNGAGIWQRNKGVIMHHNIAEDIASKVFEILNSYTTFIEIYSNGYPYINKSKASYKMLQYYNIDSHFINVIQETRKPIDSVEKLLSDDDYEIEMFDVFFKNKEERKKCKMLIKEKCNEVGITTSMANNLEIITKGINKGSGLLELCDILNADISNFIVIGDSKNDLSAFKVAKTKYAVSNARVELQRLATKIICSNDENIMEYIERELL